ncbi:MAG: hypothetical protein RL701_7714 [Pseudomonadota bacterium]
MTCDINENDCRFHVLLRAPRVQAAKCPQGPAARAARPPVAAAQVVRAVSRAPIVYPDLSNATASKLTNVNGLSGVTFAADGKIYASGETNIVDESKGTGDTAADKYKTTVCTKYSTKHHPRPRKAHSPRVCIGSGWTVGV